LGKDTTVGLDANGYLATLTNPANETIRVQHDSLGLLRGLTDAKNNPPHVFAYDSIGRLTRDTDPSGGYKSLVRQLSDTGMTATVTTALGRVRRTRCSVSSTGDTRRVHTDPAGVITTTEERANGATANGVGWYHLVDDDWAGSAFGMAAPIATQFRSASSGLSRVGAARGWTL
jgi:YD repeat-containing protein